MSVRIWEYKQGFCHISRYNESNGWAEFLNQFASDGWEYVEKNAVYAYEEGFNVLFRKQVPIVTHFSIGSKREAGEDQTTPEP